MRHDARDRAAVDLPDGRGVRHGRRRRGLRPGPRRRGARRRGGWRGGLLLGVEGAGDDQDRGGRGRHERPAGAAEERGAPRRHQTGGASVGDCCGPWWLPSVAVASAVDRPLAGLRLARGRRAARARALVAGPRRPVAARDARPRDRQEQHPGDEHGEHDGPAPTAVLSRFVWHETLLLLWAAATGTFGGSHPGRRCSEGREIRSGWTVNVILACAPSGGDKGCARKATPARRASRTGFRTTGESPARRRF